jgi:CheY-like chemotaxis protein
MKKKRFSITVCFRTQSDQAFVENHLSGQGYDLISWDQVDKKATDMILMDVHMPEMDGLETTVMIRKYEKQNQIKEQTPIVAMTAAAMKGDKERILEAGCDDYISKPIDHVRLFTVIARNSQ